MCAHARQARTAVQRRSSEEVYRCTGARAQRTRACGPTCCRSCSVFSRCESVSLATSSARSASARSVEAVSALRAACAQGGERRDGDEEDVVRAERPEVHGVRCACSLTCFMFFCGSLADAIACWVSFVSRSCSVNSSPSSCSAPFFCSSCRLQVVTPRRERKRPPEASGPRLPTTEAEEEGGRRCRRRRGRAGDSNRLPFELRQLRLQRANLLLHLADALVCCGRLELELCVLTLLGSHLGPRHHRLHLLLHQLQLLELHRAVVLLLGCPRVLLELGDPLLRLLGLLLHRLDVDLREPGRALVRSGGRAVGRSGGGGERLA